MKDTLVTNTFIRRSEVIDHVIKVEPVYPPIDE